MREPKSKDGRTGMGKFTARLVALETASGEQKVRFIWLDEVKTDAQKETLSANYRRNNNLSEKDVIHFASWQL